MTVKQARKLLGESFSNYSDDQIVAIINDARVLALGCVQKIDTKMKTDGTSYFINKAYLGVK